MLLVIMKVLYDRARSEYERKAYEQDSAARSLEAVTEQIQDLANAAGSTTKYKSSETYKNLVAYQNLYDSKNDSLKIEMDLLKQQMDS